MEPGAEVAAEVAAAEEAGAEVEVGTEVEVTVETGVETRVVDSGAIVVVSPEAAVVVDIVGAVVEPTIDAAWSASLASKAVNAIVPAIAAMITTTHTAGLATIVWKLPCRGAASGWTVGSSRVTAAVVASSAVCRVPGESVARPRLCSRAVASWAR